MRVLYVSKALVAAAYRDKVAGLSESVDVTAVVPPRWGRIQAEPATNGVSIRWQPAVLHGRNHLHVYRGAARMLDETRPDLVHIDEEPYSVVTLQLARACVRGGIPFVFFAWQNLLKRLPWPFERVRTAVYRRAAEGVAGTDAAAEVLDRSGFAGPVTVIPQFGVDPGRFRARPDLRTQIRSRVGIDDDTTVVLFAGRLRREKGIVDLLEAARTVDRMVVVLVGDGPLAPVIHQRLKQQGRHPDVRLVGAVPSADMPAWYNAADVTVLPSHTTAGWCEQFGRCLVESMACGTPVVGSDSGEIPEVVGSAGRIVPEGNVSALRKELVMLRDNPSGGAVLGRAGRQRVLDRFTNDHIVEQTLQVYRRVGGKRS